MMDLETLLRRSLSRLSGPKPTLSSPATPTPSFRLLHGGASNVNSDLAWTSTKATKFRLAMRKLRSQDEARSTSLYPHVKFTRPVSGVLGYYAWWAEGVPPLGPFETEDEAVTAITAYQELRT